MIHYINGRNWKWYCSQGGVYRWSWYRGWPKLLGNKQCFQTLLLPFLPLTLDDPAAIASARSVRSTWNKEFADQHEWGETCRNAMTPALGGVEDGGRSTTDLHRFCVLVKWRKDPIAHPGWKYPTIECPRTSQSFTEGIYVDLWHKHLAPKDDYFLTTFTLFVRFAVSRSLQWWWAWVQTLLLFDDSVCRSSDFTEDTKVVPEASSRHEESTILHHLYGICTLIKL